MSDERLAELLKTGTVEDCIQFFRGMPEERRRELAPQCLKWAKEVKRNRFVENTPSTFSISDRVEPAIAAVYCTGTLGELKQVSWSWLMPHEKVEILSDRRPAWLDAWVEMALGDHLYWAGWRAVRPLVRNNVVKKPTHPNYYLGMINGLVFMRQTESLRKALLQDPELLDDELWHLFEFEGGGENSLANFDRWSLGERWSQVLVAFMQEGRLPRERLLDSSLGALARDFNHYRAGWFAEFYDALKPTDDELTQHAERLLDLLRVSAPNVVSWAFQKVKALAARGAFAVERLTSSLLPVLRAKSKGIVKEALAVLAAAAKEQPDVAVPIGATVAEALAHENADVQGAVVKVLTALGVARDRAVLAKIKKYERGIAASVKKSLAALLAEKAANSRADEHAARQEPSARPSKATASNKPKSVPSAAASKLAPRVRELFAVDQLAANLKAGTLAIPAAVFDGTEISRLAGRDPLVPIEDFDELIEVCSRVIEDETLVDDAERCFDGLSRLCASKPADFERRCGPLLKRVRKLVATKAPPFVGIGPWDDLCGVIYALGTGTVIRSKAKGNMLELIGLEDADDPTIWGANMSKALGFLSQRSIAIAERVAVGEAAPLLSAPTHAGGWIDPAQLVRRVNEWQGAEPDEPDVTLALLRLAPDGRAAALKKLKPAKDEWRRAIEYALGGDVSIGKRAALWVAAARSRAPWANDAKVEKAFPNLGPDAGTAADFSFRFKIDRYKHPRLTLESIPPAPKTVDRALPTVLLHSQRAHGDDLTFELGGSGGKTVGAVRWSAMIWPLVRESYFAAGWEDLVDNVDWWEANWQFRSYLEPLLDSGTPLRRMGLLLLVTCLAAKEPGEQGLSIDAAIRAIEDGRLGSDNLGQAVSELLPTGIIKPGRWQKAFTDIARISTTHAAVVFIGLQAGLRGEIAKLPKDIGKLLELLRELAHELSLPIHDAGCREWLQQFGTSGKSGKLARELLAMSDSDANDCVSEILTAAIDLRGAAAVFFSHRQASTHGTNEV